MKPDDPIVPAATRQGRTRWQEASRKALEERPSWKKDWTTVSGAEVDPLAGPDTAAGFDPERDLGWPGEYPFTRGVQATGYRGKLWTMRQFAGYGTAKQTNARFHYLLEHGQTGLSTAFHLPTLYG
ncbi:MAG: methylmalonyl-CoA mutase family protein, partial [Thermoanaerobaculia bacterium]